MPQACTRGLHVAPENARQQLRWMRTATAGRSWRGHRAQQKQQQQLLLLLLLLGAAPLVRAPEVKLAAAAAGKTAQLACHGGSIAIQSAIFTKAAGSTAVCTPTIPGSVPDVTHVLAAACNGKLSCAFPVCPFKGFGAGDCPHSVMPPLGDPCPNVPKDFAADWKCTASGGWSLVALILGCGGLYVGLGVLFGSRAGGKRIALASHPHHRQWGELRALALDGLVFARALAHGQAAAGYEPVCRAAAAAGSDERAERPDEGKTKGGGSRGHSKREKPAPTAKRDRKKNLPKGEAGASSPRKGQRTPRDEVKSAIASESVAPGNTSAAGGGGRWVHIV
jgi:hypothetical protein